MSQDDDPSLAPLHRVYQRRSLGLAVKYLWRALCLRCPECGISPVFSPARRIRRLSDWFTPLDGCPICGYPYEREMGYFLMATWAVTYGAGVMMGLAVYIYMEYVANASLSTMLWTIIPLVVLFNLLSARHAKTLWLAIDHFFDPHVTNVSGGEDDGDGNVPRNPPPARPGDSGTSAPREDPVGSLRE